VDRAWVVLLAVAVIGCGSGRQPAAVAKPRQDDRSKARHSGLIDAPPLIKNVVLSSGSRPFIWPYADLDGPPPINAMQAVKIAEEFVHDNGYTDYVPPDSSKLVSESIEWEGREKWIADRHDTLRSRALGFMNEARNDPSGWTVGFEYVKPSDRRHGRAVTLDTNGRKLRMQHVDFILKYLTPRPVEESK
jgi:hypothetical protein